MALTVGSVGSTPPTSRRFADTTRPPDPKRVVLDARRNAHARCRRRWRPRQVLLSMQSDTSASDEKRTFARPDKPGNAQARRRYRSGSHASMPQALANSRSTLRANSWSSAESTGNVSEPETCVSDLDRVAVGDRNDARSIAFGLGSGLPPLPPPPPPPGPAVKQGQGLDSQAMPSPSGRGVLAPEPRGRAEASVPASALLGLRPIQPTVRQLRCSLEHVEAPWAGQSRAVRLCPVEPVAVTGVCASPFLARTWRTRVHR